MAQYQKIDGECSKHVPLSKGDSYYKEEHLEIDLFQRDSDLRHRYITCTKNPGHEQFIPIKDLTLDDFPGALRYQSVLDYVIALSQLVVRLKVKVTSSDRPKEDPFSKLVGRGVLRGATGSVCHQVDLDNIRVLPCKDDCILSGSNHSVYGFIPVRTNRHVVHDAKEAESTEVECFFDTPDRLGVVTLKGHDVQRDTENGECVIVRCVTHDLDFIKKVHRLVEAAKILGQAIPRSVKDCSMIDFVVIVSHPHGTSKVVSIGGLVEYQKMPDKAGVLKRFFREVSGKQKYTMRVTTYTTPTCVGCTGAPAITGYDESWGWWEMAHSTANLASGVQMAFTSK